jgi:Lrp/AsnC family leucine-responsive transcriptional regulator
MLDETARRILDLLQREGRISTAEIGRRLELAQSTVYERIREMERVGVIEGYVARLSAARLERALVAFVQVRTGRRKAAAVAARLAAVPDVQEVHHVAGADGLLVKLRARDTGDLQRLLREHFEPLDAIESTHTAIVLETVKESAALAL